MNTRRLILIIAISISALSLLGLFLLNENSIILNICIGLLSSSLVTFLIEIPSFYIEKRMNINRLFDGLYGVYGNLIQYKTYIERLLKNNDAITDSFASVFYSGIVYNSNTVFIVDDNTYIFKKRKSQLRSIKMMISKMIQDINTQQLILRVKTDEIKIMKLSNFPNQFCQVNASELNSFLVSFDELISAFSKYILDSKPVFFNKNDVLRWNELSNALDIDLKKFELGNSKNNM